MNTDTTGLLPVKQADGSIDFVHRCASGYEYKNDGVIKPRSTGRNEKCPCGSGKKFKKCCMYAGITSVKPPIETDGKGATLNPANKAAILAMLILGNTEL